MTPYRAWGSEGSSPSLGEKKMFPSTGNVWRLRAVPVQLKKFPPCGQSLLPPWPGQVQAGGVHRRGKISPELLLTFELRSSQRFSWHRCVVWRAGKQQPDTEEQEHWQKPALRSAALQLHRNCLILYRSAWVLGRGMGQGQCWCKAAGSPWWHLQGHVPV